MIMHNEFPGKCYRCGLRVAKGAGIVSRPTSEHLKAWRVPSRRVGSLVEHEECAKEFAGTYYHYIYLPRTK